MLFMRTARKTVQMKNGQTFGSRLRSFRKTQGLTQGELGEAIGASTRAVCSYERNECDPPVYVLAGLASALNVSIDDLLSRNGGKEIKQEPTPRRWIRKIEQIQKLPEHKQKAIVQVLDMALKSQTSDIKSNY